MQIQIHWTIVMNGVGSCEYSHGTSTYLLIATTWSRLMHSFHIFWGWGWSRLMRSFGRFWGWAIPTPPLSVLEYTDSDDTL